LLHRSVLTAPVQRNFLLERDRYDAVALTNNQRACGPQKRDQRKMILDR
jgi:hypothetical protein